MNNENILDETSGALQEIHRGHNHALQMFFLQVHNFENEYFGQDKDEEKCAGLTQYITRRLYDEVIILKALHDAIGLACDLRGRLRYGDKA